MKSFFIVVTGFGLLGALLFMPVAGRSVWARAQAHGIPAAVMRSTAHGLRAGWDWLAGLGQDGASRGPARSTPVRPPRYASRKAQAASAQPVRRTSREGILPQPPKERLERSDRDALQRLVANAR